MGILAEVAEQADALRSGRSGLYAHVGSTPTFGTYSQDRTHHLLHFIMSAEKPLAEARLFRARLETWHNRPQSFQRGVSVSPSSPRSP
jgi:hypothetical protein